MNKLNIQLNNNIEVVDTNTVAKLYLAATSISEPQEGELDLAYLSGNLLVNKSYRSQVDYLMNRFLDLNITVSGDYYIPFEDNEVLSVLLLNNIGDGIGVTEGDASNVSIGNLFAYNTDITKFNELRYFTTNSNNYCPSFLSCSNLEEITLPNSLVRIPVNTFMNCSKLKSINMPDKIKNCDNNAFTGCTDLNSVYVSDIEVWCDIAFGSITSTPLYLANHLYVNSTELTNVVIPDTITALKNCVFAGGTNIISVTIPDSVTSIGNSAFSNCTGLTSITIPNSVTSIGSSAFLDCTGLTSIYIPNSVTSIGAWCFLHVNNLTSVYITDLESWFTISFYHDGSSPFHSTNTGSMYLNNIEITDLIVPNTITEIKLYVFFNCKGLTSITIPNSVTKIGNAAFKKCSNVLTINLSDNVIDCASDAFEGCSSVTNPVYNSKYFVRLPVSYDGQYNIPNNISVILDGAFTGCSKLTLCNIPNTVTVIPNTCFRLSKILSITIPSYVTDIGVESFYMCNGLTTVDIPDSTSTIGVNCFYSCTNLSSVNIGTGVLSIGASAFRGCNKLESITIKATTPPTLGTTVFQNTHTNLIIYVPASAVDTYKAAPGWSTYASRIQAIPST